MGSGKKRVFLGTADHHLPMKKRLANETSQYPFETRTESSIRQGQFALEWLLDPTSLNTFFSTVFEKRPQLMASKGNTSKFSSLISLAQIERLLLDGKLRYGSDLDVTRYSVEKGRTTHNKLHDCVAGNDAWDHFKTGASLRLLRPQTQADGIYRLCAHLEGFLECVVGANVYVTPVDCQGFAPHFDDIDAFICQVAGRKRWRVYQPREDGLDLLPRQSSVDFNLDDMKDSKPVIDTVLGPGDMLYLPRGTIHEARCVHGDGGDAESETSELSSVHVTISMFQRWTWADLLTETVSMAIRSAATEDVRLRRTLPLRFGRYAGAFHSGGDENVHDFFHNRVGRMLRRVSRSYPSDAAADVLAARFMQERLPPVVPKADKPSNRSMTSNTRIRAVGANFSRLVVDTEGDTQGVPRLLHCMDNNVNRERLKDGDEVNEGGTEGGSDDTNGSPQFGMNCLPEEAQVIELILNVYPRSVSLQEIPMDKRKGRDDLISGLVDMGVIEFVDP